METRANYALIGLFTIVVIAMGFAFVWWFAGRDSAGSREQVRIVFSGSVSGLSRGSSVLFNGLRVGEVTDIRLLPEDPRRVVSLIQIDRETPLKADTRARLEYQGLTGVASIALVGGAAEAGPLVPQPGQPIATIFAEQSDFQNLFETVRTISRRAEDVIARVDRLIADNEGSLGRTVRNVEQFSQALSDNSAGVSSFLASVGQAAERIGPLAQRLDSLATDIQGLVRAVDPQRVSNVVANVESFTQTLGENRANIDTILKDTASVTSQLRTSAVKFDEALQGITDLTRAVDAQKIGRVVDNAEKFSVALGRSSGDVEAALKDAASIAAKLNQSADRIDGVLKAAEAFLGSAAGQEGKNAFAEVGEAARSIRVLADNLDKRTAEITTGINRFTGPGLREYEALAADGRRTLSQLNRIINSLERNPQQVIFGGKPSIPQYTGR